MTEPVAARSSEVVAHPIVSARKIPWTQLLRAPRLAFDIRKCVLGAFGLVMTKAGWDGLLACFDKPGWIAPEVIHPFPFSLGSSPGDSVRIVASIVAEPMWIPIAPLLGVLETHGGVATFAYAVSCAVWALAVWSIVGGAISRIAVMELTTGEKTSMGVALRFAARRMVSLVGGPFTALFGFGLFAAFCAAFGLTYRIPWIGPTLGGMLFFLPLIFGVIMALILVGLILGWPLMVTTVSAESEDAFDAMSRSSGYIQQRTVRFLAYGLLSWILGMLSLIAVSLFVWLLIHLAAWGVAFGAPDDLIAKLLSDPSGSPAAWPARIHAGWIGLVGLVANGFVPAFFWSSGTIVYLLLRLDVDGAAWEQVWRDR